MKKRGFTLIELLAVIVVLAIIALIATPIVMNVIKKANEGAVERSADNYVKAVETLIATEKLDGTPLVDGDYVIDNEGKLTKDGSSYEVEVSGAKPVGGTVKIEKGQVVKDSSKINYTDHTVTFENGKAKAGDKEVVKDAAYYGINYYTLSWYGETTPTTLFYIDPDKAPEGYYDTLNRARENYDGSMSHEENKQILSDYDEYLLEIANFIFENYETNIFNSPSSFLLEAYKGGAGNLDLATMQFFKDNNGKISYNLGACYC